MADNVKSHQPSRVALLGSFLVGAGVAAAGVTIQPIAVIVLAVALVVGGDFMASRAPDSVVPRQVHFARAIAAGLGVVTLTFLLMRFLDY